MPEKLRVPEKPLESPGRFFRPFACPLATKRKFPALRVRARAPAARAASRLSISACRRPRAGLPPAIAPARPGSCHEPAPRAASSRLFPVRAAGPGQFPLAGTPAARGPPGSTQRCRDAELRSLRPRSMAANFAGSENSAQPLQRPPQSPPRWTLKSISSRWRRSNSFRRRQAQQLLFVDPAACVKRKAIQCPAGHTKGGCEFFLVSFYLVGNSRLALVLTAFGAEAPPIR